MKLKWELLKSIERNLEIRYLINFFIKYTPLSLLEIQDRTSDIRILQEFCFKKSWEIELGSEIKLRRLIKCLFIGVYIWGKLMGFAASSLGILMGGISTEYFKRKLW